MKKILIVDDHWEVRYLVNVSLRSDKYALSSAVNGIEAWEMITEGCPDLVVLDIMMPGIIDGLAILRRIRAVPGLAACKVVLLSGKGQQSDLVDGISAGADAYLVKPFSPRELVAQVEKLLGE